MPLLSARAISRSIFPPLAPARWPTILTVWYSAKYERKGFTSTFEDEAVRLEHVQTAPTPFVLDLYFYFVS